MAWNDLSIPQRSQLMNMFRRNGVVSLSEMKRLYDLSSSPSLVEKPLTAPVYADGGPKKTYEYYEDDPDFVGPALPSTLYAGPPVPPGYGEAPVDWDAVKSKQRYMESTYNDKAYNRGSQAKGAFQITPVVLQEYTARTGNTGDLYDPVFNEEVRDWYMNVRLPEFQALKRGHPSDSVRTGIGLASFNAGPVAVNKALTKAQTAGIDTDRTFDWLEYLPKETQDYVNFGLRGKDIPGTSKTQENYQRVLDSLGVEYAKGGNLFWPGGKKKTLFDKQKVLNRVYGDGQAFAEGNGGITSSVMEYLFNDDNAVEKRIQDAEYGAKKYEDVLKSGNPDLIYKTFRDLPKEEQRLFDLGRMVDVIKQHEDAKRIYLGYEPKYGQVERAKYHPTIGNSEEPYQVNSLLTDGEFNNLIVPLWSQWKTGIGENIPVSEGYLGLRYTQKPRVENKGNVALVKNLPFISDATMSMGLDDKGQYLSLYDIWDYNTNVIGTPGDNVGKHIGGKPFEIYQRYYLDDWFDIPENERGYPYIAPAYVTAEKARGGKIHIKKKNRGKFTALKKRTGHSASWFKAHGTPAQKKMAVFALNSRKWKHSYGGIIF